MVLVCECRRPPSGRTSTVIVTEAQFPCDYCYGKAPPAKSRLQGSAPSIRQSLAIVRTYALEKARDLISSQTVTILNGVTSVLSQWVVPLAKAGHVSTIEWFLRGVLQLIFYFRHWSSEGESAEMYWRLSAVQSASKMSLVTAQCWLDSGHRGQNWRRPTEFRHFNHRGSAYKGRRRAQRKKRAGLVQVEVFDLTMHCGRVDYHHMQGERLAANIVTSNG